MSQRNQGWTTIAIFAVAMTLILCVVAYQVYKDIKSTLVIRRCAVGLCKFDIYTGRKTCPASNDIEGLQISEGLEYCTSANFCQQDKYKCAVNPDQTIDCSGECSTPECRCVANPTNGPIPI